MCFPPFLPRSSPDFVKAQREEIQARMEAQAEAIRRHNAAANEHEAMASDVEDADWREIETPRLPAT